MNIILYLLFCAALLVICLIIKESIKDYRTPRFNVEKEMEAYINEQDSRTYNGKTMKEIFEAQNYDLDKDPVYIKALAENEVIENIVSRLNKHFSLQDMIIKCLKKHRKNMEMLAGVGDIS